MPKIEEFPIEEFPVDEVEAKPSNVSDALLGKVRKAPGRVADFISRFLPSEETVEDTARGGLQGASLGFADEAQGALQAIPEAIQKRSLSEFPSLYRTYQKAAEKVYEESKARSPKAYLAGELGGGLLAGLATAGAAAPEAIGATMLERAAPTVLEQAITGAKLGGIAAAGGSKHTLDDSAERNKLGADIIGGSAMGGALGGGVGLIGKGLSSTSKYIGKKLGEVTEEQPLLRQAKKAYGMGKEGLAVNESETAANRMAREQLNDIEDLTGQLRDAQEALGKPIGEKIKEKTLAGVKLKKPEDTGIQEMSELLHDNRFLIGTQDEAKLSGALSKFSSGEMTPEEGRSLKILLRDLQSSNDTPQFNKIYKELYDQTDNALKEAVPEIAELNQKYTKFLSSGPEVLLSKGQPTSVVKKFMSDLADPDAKIADAVTDMVSTLTSPGVSKTASRRMYTELIDNLNAFDKSNPGTLEKIGIGVPDEFAKKIRDVADKFAISRQILGYEPHAAPGVNLKGALTTIGGQTGRGRIVGAANVVGRMAKATSESGPAKLGRSLYQMPEDGLLGIARTLEEAELPGISSLGVALRRGLSEKNQGMKNAALFTIMQNPKARLLISPEDLEEAESNAEGNSDSMNSESYSGTK